MKLRPGDQPLPIVNGQPFVQDAVIADIEARKQVGIERYGTPLQPFNGRDALRDAYEEAIDLTMYLKQLLIERDGCPTCQGRGEVPATPGYPGDGPMPCPTCQPPTCPECGRELHGYRGPLCRYCDPRADSE